jgi:hypothetical protein
MCFWYNLCTDPRRVYRYSCDKSNLSCSGNLDIPDAVLSRFVSLLRSLFILWHVPSNFRFLLNFQRTLASPTCAIWIFRSDIRTYGCFFRPILFCRSGMFFWIENDVVPLRGSVNIIYYSFCANIIKLTSTLGCITLICSLEYSAMRTRFYQTSTKSSRTTLGVKRKVNRPKLSADARAALLARRRQASQNYKNALGETWDTIDKLTEDLAIAHRKSLQRVQCELHMGHRLAHKTRQKTNAWNAFTWKKSQDKENSAWYAEFGFD